MSLNCHEFLYLYSIAPFKRKFLELIVLKLKRLKLSDRFDKLYLLIDVLFRSIIHHKRNQDSRIMDWMLLRDII